MNAMVNPLAKSRTKVEDDMSGGKNRKRKSPKIKKIKRSRQEKEIKKKEQAEKALMLKRASKTQRSGGAQGRGRSKSKTKRSSKPNLAKDTKGTSKKESEDSKIKASNNTATSTEEQQVLPSEMSTEEQQVLQDQGSKKKEAAVQQIDQTATKQRRASFWTSTLVFEAPLEDETTQKDINKDAVKSEEKAETSIPGIQTVLMENNETEPESPDETSNPTIDTTTTTRLPTPTLTTKFSSKKSPPSTSQIKEITPTTTLTKSTSVTDISNVSTTRTKPPSPSLNSSTVSEATNNRRARLLAMQKKIPSTKTVPPPTKKRRPPVPPRVRRKVSTSDSAGNKKIVENTTIEIDQKTSKKDIDQKNVNLAKIDATNSIQSIQSITRSSTTQSSKMTENQRKRRRSLSMIKKMRASHVEAKIKTNRIEMPSISISPRTARTATTATKAAMQPAMQRSGSPFRPTSKAPGPTEVESMAHRLEMESKQLPLPKEVKQKHRQEMKQRVSITKQRDPLSSAVAGLRESIVTSTARANQIQRNIFQQQQELADVLIILRKQDRAAKLLANYAKDITGVNPLMLVQEIQAVLS